MAKLLIEKGVPKGRTYTISGDGVYLCGREMNCTIPCEDALASRRHFRIEHSSDRFVLVDENSRNGTFLNGRPVSNASLHYGDCIRVGNTYFAFLSDDEAMIRGGLVGKVIAGYLIEQRLGFGGMGTVYKAKQLSLQRDVAIKFLSPERTQDPAFIERFIQEARACGRLNHPCIVQVYDVGNENGQYFYTMEYLAGGSMEDLLNHTDRILPIGALHMMVDVARGLQFAEAQGIVHRDIKPENLMLDDEGNVKICDLGLAIKLEEVSNGVKKALGTPQYMSPEQAMGRPVDHRSDIYSLGCTLYRMISGRFPFTGATVSEILEKQVCEEAPPLHTLFDDVSPSVGALVAWMMAKSPDNRPANATALLEELKERLIEEKGGTPSKAPVVSFTRPKPASLEEETTLPDFRNPRRSTTRSRAQKCLFPWVQLATAFIIFMVVAGLILSAITFPRSSDRIRKSRAGHPAGPSRPQAEAVPADGEARRAPEVSSQVKALSENKIDNTATASDTATQEWEQVVASAQKYVKGYRFGDALSLFEQFERRYPGSAKRSLARRCAEHTRELAERHFLIQSTEAERLRRSGDEGASKELYTKIALSWGMEPYVSEANQRLAEMAQKPGKKKGGPAGLVSTEPAAEGP